MLYAALFAAEKAAGVRFLVRLEDIGLIQLTRVLF